MSGPSLRHVLASLFIIIVVSTLLLLSNQMNHIMGLLHCIPSLIRYLSHINETATRPTADQTQIHYPNGQIIGQFGGVD